MAPQSPECRVAVLAFAKAGRELRQRRRGHQRGADTLHEPGGNEESRAAGQPSGQ